MTRFPRSPARSTASIACSRIPATSPNIPMARRGTAAPKDTPAPKAITATVSMATTATTRDIMDIPMARNSIHIVTKR